MCGIVGYSGELEAVPVLLEGLSKLEYRGYDSAGIAVLGNDKKIKIKKMKGRIADLSRLINDGADVLSNTGIGHTRWATHGEPNDVNSHPHMSNSGKFAIVHNGIIENYLELKSGLISEGVSFSSETDSEVAAQLLDKFYDGDLIGTVKNVIGRLRGSYALGIVCSDYPDKIIAVRRASPLIVGISEKGNFIASDIPAVLSYTKDIYRLAEDEIAEITAKKVTFYNENLEPVEKRAEHISWDVHSAEKGGYDHFMIKEIYEEPEALHATIFPRISKNGEIILDGVKLTRIDLLSISKIFIVGCGSAYHVGVAAKYIMEKMLRIPVEAELASEFRYRSPIVDKNTLVIIISQSGETADTLAALREAKALGARILSVVNVVGSSIANESDDVLYTWAGPEIAVATTKAYSTQLSMMYIISLYIARLLCKISIEEYRSLISDIKKIPDAVKKIIEDLKPQVISLANEFKNLEHAYYIGRNLDYAVAMEASLKLKEVSYVHSEAYAAGELKHGTISLIENGTLVVALASYGELIDKTVSNIKEVKARGARVLTITTEGCTAVEECSDYVLYLPEINPAFAPSLQVVPMQMLGYYMAVARGCDVDKPRNLAKSVTVE